MNFNIFTFPFRQMGTGLRQLSLSGAAGNALAFALYILIAAMPILYLAWRIRKQKKPFSGEDFLLPLLSILVAVTLYLMVNPGKMSRWIALSDGASYCLTIYSIIVGWIAIKIILKIPVITEKNLVRNFRTGMIILGITLAGGIVLGIYTDLLPSIDNIYAGGNDSTSAIGSAEAYLSAGGISREVWSGGTIFYNTKILLWVRYIISQIPIILDILVIAMSVRLTRHLEADRYSEATISSAQRLGKVCIAAAIVMVLKPIFLNLIQLVMGGMTLDAAYQSEIPILSIVLVMAVFLLSSYFTKDKALKEDHDLII